MPRARSVAYPLLSATARAAQRIGADDEFLGGLNIVLNGLARLRRAGG
jgi:hypothetical protein